MGKRLISMGLIGALAFSLPGFASAETFKLSKAEMVAAFNKQLRSDEADTISGCQVKPDNVVCAFTHAQFGKAVDALKKLDVVNGRFEDKAHFAMALKGDKVETATVIGDRGDPANLFRTMSMVASFVQALGATDEETKVLVGELGLMRGDDDPTIGTPKVNITRVAAVTCNSLPSSRTTRIGCVFEPRY